MGAQIKNTVWELMHTHTRTQIMITIVTFLTLWVQKVKGIFIENILFKVTHKQGFKN